MPLGTTGPLLAGRYRVIRRLGSGGMATVFLAEDQRLGREVAIKRLHADSPEDVARRFDREAKVGASLNHPNLVAVFDTATDEEGVLIVMEFVDGETLRDEIATAGSLPPARALEVIGGVAAALDHAHEHGVVHRDVKPANVLIPNRGLVKLADLGIAAAAEGTRITRSGTVLGTAAYMAPERLDGHAGGPEVDVYALAAVAFEALSGEKAVTGKTAIEVARRVITQPPRDLAEVVEGTPRAAAEALQRGLAKAPADRQRTALELVRELEAAYGDRTETAATRPVRRAAAAAGAGAGAALGTAAASQRPVGARAPAPAAASAAKAEPALPSDRLGRVATSKRAEERPRRRIAPVLIAAAAACALAALLVALATAGGGSGAKTAHSRTAAHKTSPPAGAGSSASSSGSSPAGSSTGGSSATGAAPSASAGGPADAVKGFYTLAAAKNFTGAWALGTDNLHAQVGGYDSWKAGESDLQSFSFPSLTVTSQTARNATVQFTSLAAHAGRTDSCTGSASVVNNGQGWLVDQLIGVNCAPAGGPASGASAQPPASGGPPGKQKPGKQKPGKDHGGD